MEIPGGRGVIKDPLEWKFLRGGGGLQTKNLLWEGYGYFLEPNILVCFANDETDPCCHQFSLFASHA